MSMTSGGGAAYALKAFEPSTIEPLMIFFFQAEDGIRDVAVTGVQTCALPIFAAVRHHFPPGGTKGRGHPAWSLGGNVERRHPVRPARQRFAGVRARLSGTGKTLRSEERRVGKECRSRWSPYH